MDGESYEQIVVERSLIEVGLPFLQEGMELTVEMFESEPIGIVLPETVPMPVTEPEPVVKGQTAASSFKPALLENGERVMVPPHIEAGTRGVINIAEATYAERAKD